MEISRKERVCTLALNTIFGNEPKIARTLLLNLGSSEAVFALDSDRKREVFGPFSKYTDRINSEALDNAEKELDFIESEGCSFILSSEDCYPKALLECEDCPVGLYVRSGTPLPELFNRGPYISIVGTRDMSQYGKEWCERIVGTMAKSSCPPTIVSGLAIGVDITAHMAALAYGIPTIAVIPCGIEDVYPHRHWVAARKITESPGSALITDFHTATGAMAATFLKRNRIIAGMSHATILIESKVKGGGMITARLASGYGREVWCLPGRIDDLRSSGCNLLIQEKTAEPIVSLTGLTETMGLGRFTGGRQDSLAEIIGRQFRDDPMLEDLKKTASTIKKERGISLDELCARLGIPYGTVTVLTGKLESAGLISTDLLQRCAITAKI